MTAKYGPNEISNLSKCHFEKEKRKTNWKAMVDIKINIFVKMIDENHINNNLEKESPHRGLKQQFLVIQHERYSFIWYQSGEYSARARSDFHHLSLQLGFLKSFGPCAYFRLMLGANRTACRKREISRNASTRNCSVSGQNLRWILPGGRSFYCCFSSSSLTSWSIHKPASPPAP